ACRRPRRRRSRREAVRRWRKRGSSQSCGWLVGIAVIVGAAGAAIQVAAAMLRGHLWRSRLPPLLQDLFEDFEAQVAAPGDAEAFVAVRERLVGAGAPIAAALVERDQLVADVDHG